MPNTKQNFRTKSQNARMHAIGSKLGLTHEDLQDYAFEYSKGRTSHTSELYVAECENLNNYLDKLANPNQTPRRTVNYRRSKTNVVSLETAKQAKLLDDLWFEFEHRTASGLESICLRTIKVAKPRSTREFNKIIEAVKSMNDREKKKRSTQLEAV